MSDKPGSAGVYFMDFMGKPMAVQRAWYCPKCTCSWYDTGRECPLYKQNHPDDRMTGVPEKLPKGAREKE